VFFLFWGGKSNDKKITKIKKYNKGLRWPLFDILHVTSNQKHTGVMEGGWSRTHDRARTLGKRDFIMLGLFIAPKRDPLENRERGRGLGVAKEGAITDGNDEYAIGNDSKDEPLAECDDKDDVNDDNDCAKDGDIANNNNKYTIGNDGADEPLAKGDNKNDTLSAPPVCKHALRVSAQACPHAESIILSAGSAESMILLENVQKMQEERAGETRARAVSHRQIRHRLFLVKRQDKGPLRIMQTRHLKVSKSKTTCPNHVDKRYKRYKKMLTWPKDMQGTRVRATK
jgi:hypothetical protein